MRDEHSERSTLLDDVEHRPVGASEASDPLPEQHALTGAATTGFARKRILPPSRSEEDYATPSRWFG
ncbi:MAG: hypothetical protein ACLP8S_08485 [Solirubrobacteraceae bacterium]